MTPELPLVGAVTTRPNEAFTSFTAKEKQVTHLRISRNCTFFSRMAVSQPSSVS